MESPTKERKKGHKSRRKTSKGSKKRSQKSRDRKRSRSKSTQKVKRSKRPSESLIESGFTSAESTTMEDSLITRDRRRKRTRTKQKRKSSLDLSMIPRRETKVKFDLSNLKSVKELKGKSTNADTLLKEFMSGWEKQRQSLKQGFQEEDDFFYAVDDQEGTKQFHKGKFRSCFVTYRNLRELIIRFSDTNAQHTLRKLMSMADPAHTTEKKSAHALKCVKKLLKFIEVEVETLLPFKEKMMVRPVAESTIEVIVGALQDSAEEHDGLDEDKWISYVSFLGNPSSEFERLLKTWRRIYMRTINSLLIQSMMNNCVSIVKKMVARKLPKWLKEHPDFKYSAIQRVDKQFSRFFRRRCPQTCEGHRGKLLLVLIRLGLYEMVELALNYGLSPTSRCCSGPIRKLYWLENELEIEEPDVMDAEFYNNSFLVAEYTYVTPLSVAVDSSNLRIVNFLLDKGCSPLQCHDIAIKTGIQTVMSREMSSQQKANKSSGVNTMARLLTDNEAIFSLIINRAEMELKHSRYAQPNYCRSALVFASVVQVNWTAYEMLTALKGKSKYSKILGKYDVDHASFTPESVDGNGNRRGNLRRRNAAPFSGSSWFIRRMFMRMRNMVRFRRGLGKRNGREMTEDLCFTLVSVIDYLLDALFVKNCFAHAPFLIGIVEIMERHEIMLDNDRMEMLLRAAVKAMDEYKPGDNEGVVRLFKNAQMRHFLEFEIDAFWKKRNMNQFIKRVKIKKFMSIKNKSRKKRQLKLYKNETRESLISDILIFAAKRDIAFVISDFHSNGIEADEYTKTMMMNESVLEESLSCIRETAKCYGKYLLQKGLVVSLENKLFASCVEILDLDNEIFDKDFSLLANYVTNPLFFEKEVKFEGRLLSDEEQNIDLKEFEETLEFFFTAAKAKGENKISIKKELLRQILVNAFAEKKNFNYSALALFIASTCDLYSDFINEDLIRAFIKSKPTQYDELEVMLERLSINGKSNRSRNTSKRTSILSNQRSNLSSMRSGASEVSRLSQISRTSKNGRKSQIKQKIRNEKNREEQRLVKKDLREKRWVNMLARMVNNCQNNGNGLSPELWEECKMLFELKPQAARHGMGEEEVDDDNATAIMSQSEYSFDIDEIRSLV